MSGDAGGGHRYPDDETECDPYDPEPGYYCCLSPGCDHVREQVFNGGSA